MEKDLSYLIRYLINDGGEKYVGTVVPAKYDEQLIVLRSLMNLWFPGDIDQSFLDAQDKFLKSESQKKGIVDVTSLPLIKSHKKLTLWQGDITRLKVDAIVNAANNQMLGCFIPMHKCIDNAIHFAAGLQLRTECAQIMNKQGHSEPVGKAKITSAYNLPAKHVIHTVGPYIEDIPSAADIQCLASCYLSILKLSDEYGLKSIAFCCISTGEFRFPSRQAAAIAVSTVRDYLVDNNTSLERVVFNVYKNQDYQIYEELLG